MPRCAFPRNIQNAIVPPLRDLRLIETRIDQNDMEKSPLITIKLIKLLLPHIEEMIAASSGSHGFFNLDPLMVSFLSKGQATPWATYYQSANQLKSLALFSLIDPESIPEFAESLKTSTLEEKTQFSEELQELALSAMTNNNVSDTAIKTEEEVKEWWASASEEERTHEITRETLRLYTAVTQFFHYCGIMTFGKSLCDLVVDAINGDDSAFCNAVQIDKTTLYSIPYFRERLARAQLSSDPAFLKKLSAAITGKPLAGYIKHKALMFVFAILDDEGLLGMPAEELFDLCEELGIYGHKFGIYEIGTFIKRRSYYLKKTGRKLHYSRPS